MAFATRTATDSLHQVSRLDVVTPAVDTGEWIAMQAYRLAQAEADRKRITGVHPLLGNKTTLLALLLGSVLVGQAVIAQQGQQPASDQPMNSAGQPFAPDARDASPPTAEEVLQALRRRRPQNRVIEPASALERVGKPIVAEPLYPEGASVVDQIGRLTAGKHFWMLLLDQQDETAAPPVPIKLLPNAVLEGMVAASKSAAHPPSFKISGEVTVYDKENYLLARVSSRAAPAPKNTPPPVAPDVAIDASTDDILSAFAAVEARPNTMPLRADSEAAPGGSAVKLPDGTPLISRPGRLIRDGDWWTFVFESNSADYAEPPLRLLPNKNLDLMIHVSRGSPSGIVLIVSGEVTAFRQRNYLLVRAATRRIDTGNLKK